MGPQGGSIHALLALLIACASELPPEPEGEHAPRALAPSAGHPPPLPPTEHWVHQDAEMTNKAQRKEYFRERHRAAPDVDWKAVERANGLAALARRNAHAGRRSGEPTGARWVERGSENQAGRMMVAALSADGEALYAGSSLGGVWRGSLQGDDWVPLGDGLYGGAHFLLVFPPDVAGGPEVMVAGTDGGMIHRSADDGLTWQVPAGIGELWEVRRLVALQDGSDTAFAVVGEPYGSRVVVLRSTDRGASWTELRSLGDWTGDLWVPRDGGSTIWLLDRGRVYTSSDLGDSWSEAGAIPGDAGSGGELAGSEAGAPRLWAAVHGSGGDTLFRSDDAGASWTELRELDDYWSVLTASVVDPDRVAWGGVEVHRSTDGGDRFAVVNAWSDYYDDPVGKLHADIMGIDVIPDADGGETWYVGTDGGLFASDDGLGSVENLSLRGLRVGQYYSTLTDAKDPTLLAAGAQDQGYQLTNGIAQSADRYDFDQTLSGDYGHLTSTDGTHDFVYSVYPGFLLVQQGQLDPEYAYIDFPPDPYGYAWLPAIVADPERKKAVFFPGGRLWRYDYDRSTESWEVEQWSEQSFASGYEYLSGLAFAPSDPERAYGVTSRGRLFRSSDKGRTWHELEDAGPQSHWLYGTAVLVDAVDPDTAWVAGSGYTGPGIWRTKTAGRNWQPYDEGLPDTLVSCICAAPDGSGVLFAGTETGAWRRDPDADTWVEISGIDAPITTYWSCEALQQENTIRFGTYGRGIWDYQLDPEGLGCFPPVDRDGDGVACDADCDDTDPSIHPGARDEACDEVDADCDPTNELSSEACRVRAEAADCGCDASGGPGWLWLGLVFPLIARRR